ncbi:sulfotransferase [Azospirillum sp. B506]|uniref:sulfotransferase family protein n=1 Tax=Azospirillum sp. B506 TaxID=137721 RepID=UPI00034C39B6|nr:sulfotransferase [Azospirillum sp. B506]
MPALFPDEPPSDPIFIIGTERSGSNLLRLILNAHSAITVPHPPHIMAYFAPLEGLYGLLEEDANFVRLADDVLTHVQRHIHPWPMIPDRETLIRDARPRDIFGLYAGIYDQYRVATGKRRWGCKSTFMIHHTDRIRARYPGARLIWLVRDPRDVALSSRSSVFNPFHPFFTARLWAAQQGLGLRLEESLAPANLLRVHYEALVTAPTTEVGRICDFIGERFEPTMLRFFETDDARMAAGLAGDWRNTVRPILADNVSRFRGRLSARDTAAVEAAAGPVMRRLGYEPVSPEGARIWPGVVRRLRYRLSNEVLRLLAECRSLREDRNRGLRWARRVRMALLTTRLRLSLR